MGKFKDWIVENNVAAGPVNSAGQITNPTQVAQQANQVAQSVITDKSNMKDLQNISQADMQGRTSIVKNGISNLARDAVKQFPDAKTDFKAVTSSIQSSLPLQKKNYFSPMKTFMKKEDADIEEGNFVTTPYSMINDKPQNPVMGLPKRGTTLSHMAGQRKRISPVKPASLTNPLSNRK